MELPDPKPSRNATAVAVALLVVCALSIAGMPSMAKLSYQAGSNPGTVVTIRALTAVILLGGYMLARRRAFAIPAHLTSLAVVAVISSAAMNYSFIAAIYYIDISLAILILFAHPFLICLYYHLTGSSRMTLFRLTWALLAFVGLGMALAVSLESASKLGLGLAALSAVACTVMVIAMIKVNRHVGGATTNFHMAFWSVLIFAAALAVTGNVRPPESALGWVSAIGNGTAYVVAYVAFLAASNLIGPSRATILSFMEPVATILLASALFGETVTRFQWAGIALVAAGLFFTESDFRLLRRRRAAG